MSLFYLWIFVVPNLQTYVMSEKTCGERNITGTVGGAVTLHVGLSGVRFISWGFGGKDGSFAITSPGQPPDIQGEQFFGRLSSTSDGSLTITELKHEDQGTYLAQISTSKCFYDLTVFSNLTAEDVTVMANATNTTPCEVSLTCSANSTDKSNVSIIWRSLNSSDAALRQSVMLVPHRNINFTYICVAENMVSVAWRAVHPWEYCQNGSRQVKPMKGYTTGNIICLVISGCVLLASCCILIHHLKTEVIAQRPRIGGI